MTLKLVVALYPNIHLLAFLRMKSSVKANESLAFY